MGNYYGWEKLEARERVNYSRQVILGTDPDTIELPLSEPIELQLISAFIDAANAKDINVRLFASISPAAYMEFLKVTTDTAQSNLIDMGSGYPFISPYKLQFNFANYTSDDVFDLTVIGRFL